MDAILGTKPATHPPVVVDTLQDSSDIQEDMTENENEIPENPGTSASASEESNMPKSRTTTPSPSPGVVIKSRKRKHKAESTVAEMLQMVAECQSATDQKLLEVEEKRLKLEEQQIEREVQLRREEREFQLRMMQMLVARPSFYPNEPPMPYSNRPPMPYPPPSDFYKGQNIDEQQ